VYYIKLNYFKDYFHFFKQYKMSLYLNKQHILDSLQKIKNSEKNKKIKKIKKVFKEKKLRIRYEKIYMSCEYCKPTIHRKLAIIKGDEEVAHFELLGDLCETTTDTVSLSIGIEDEFQGIQLSRIMMWSIIMKLKEENVDLNQYVYIDTDASAGFWDAIGMIPNENENGTFGEKGRGYEKKITLTNIEKWCIQ